MPERLEMSVFIAASPERLYAAWLDGEEHAAFTGSEASVDPRVGGAFSAWDGYISGRTLELEPNRRIVQSWRTSDFPPKAPDSRVEIEFREKGEGSVLALVHTLIPEGQAAEYEQGWKDYYFDPMRAYFSKARQADSPSP